MKVTKKLIMTLTNSNGTSAQVTVPEPKDNLQPEEVRKVGELAAAKGVFSDKDDEALVRYRGAKFVTMMTETPEEHAERMLAEGGELAKRAANLGDAA